jgi:hypothetical protein
MLFHPRRIAPALLASLFGLVAAAAALRAEPAPIASATSTDCLAKPTTAAAPGNHWYYHVDRASGRQCWHQRPVNAAQNDAAAQRPASAQPVAPAPVDQPAPAPAASADKPDDARDQGPAEPVIAPAAAPSAWSNAPAVPAARDEMAAPMRDGAAAATAPAVAPAPQPVIEPATAEPPPAPADRAPVRADAAERQAPPTEASAHEPALLGAALALVIIVLGSIAFRRAAKFLRSRRRAGARGVHAWNGDPPLHRMQDAPGLVPVMPRESDIVRATRPPGADSAQPDGPGSADGAVARNAESTRMLEENVRELLLRLRAQPRRSGAAIVVQPPSAQELDRVLAIWRARRRRPAG